MKFGLIADNPKWYNGQNGLNSSRGFGGFNSEDGCLVITKWSLLLLLKADLFLGRGKSMEKIQGRRKAQQSTQMAWWGDRRQKIKEIYQLAPSQWTVHQT